MARAAASRSARLILAAAFAAACLGSCAPRERAVVQPKERAEGYAYTAVLMSKHPLSPALAELELALDQLREDEWEPVLEPIDDRFADLALLESFALADPQERLAQLTQDWRRGYETAQVRPEGTEADLRARIDWERRQARRRVQERMRQARAMEARQLAKLRASLVRKYEERLTNLGIQIEMGENAEAAEAERQDVWDTIEARVQQQGKVAEQTLAELERQLETEAEQRIAEAEARAEETMLARAGEMQQAGEQMYGRMADQMSLDWPQPPADVQVTIAPGEANERLAEAEVSREQAMAARRDAAARQRERLLRAINSLRRQIKRSTEAAAKVVAYRDGIDLQLLPGGTARGRNMTQSIGERLEAFWSAEGQRS